jgi:D-amino peptidase
MGELGMNAALAGAFRKPIVLVTGDAALIREAVALLGNVETVAVKEGITRTSARCLSPALSAGKIKEAARRALKSNFSVFSVDPPITMKVVFHRAIHADMASLVPATRRIDGRTVEWTGEDMIVVYQVYRAMLALASTV